VLHELPGFEDTPCPGSFSALAATSRSGGASAIPLAKMGELVAGNMTKLEHGDKDLDRGLFYWNEYHSLCAQHSRLDLWHTDLMKGHADPVCWERTGRYQWVVRANVSASRAIKSFLRGLTICECLSVARAVEADALRSAVGDELFDREFGDASGSVDDDNRLRIGMKESSVQNRFMRRPDRADAVGPRSRGGDDDGRIGDRPLVVGARYYFANHPSYLCKHPSGIFQGENTVYLGTKNGKQTFSGFGIGEVTEQELYDMMRDDYNLRRWPADDERLKEIEHQHGGVLPARYDPKTFPDEIDTQQLLAATYPDGRRAGIRLESSVTFDLDRVRAFREGGQP
jgi:hypothetical protein